jgi:hypothetical protein
MITNTEITLLQGLTKQKPIVVKLGEGEMSLLHAVWFVLELPTNALAPDLTCWEEEALPKALEWRTLMPPGEGAYGQAIRFTNPDDNVALVKLIADTGVAIIHPSIYEVVTRHFSEPEFRVFSEEKAYVAILNSGSLIGATAQVKL